MEIFLILQLLFDAVLLFGILFLFNFFVHHSRKKKEELDILKNLQVQEIKENLQELLYTLKQLGKEVSDNIKGQVIEAEEKTEIIKKITNQLKSDLKKAVALAEEIASEKKHLEEKLSTIRIAKKKKVFFKTQNPNEELYGINDEEGILTSGNKNEKKIVKGREVNRDENGVGFSSAMVREVYRLADDENGINEIVQKTKLTRAEIQLILNLRGNRFTTPN
jgi:hypothetical protein